MSLENNMTKIMDVVRHFTGRTDKLSFDDAIKLLLNITPFDVELKFGKEFDLNNLNKTGIFWLTPNDGATKDKNNVPFDGKWWYIINLYSTEYNCFQIAIPDDPVAIYMRTKTGSNWNAWNKVGGVVKAVLSALHLERRCLA